MKAVLVALAFLSNEADALALKISAPRRASRGSSVAMSLAPRRALPAALAAGAAALTATGARAAEAQRWAASELLDQVKSGAVEKATFASDSSGLVAVDSDGARHDVQLLSSQTSEVVQLLRSKGVPFDVAAPVADAGQLVETVANVGVPLLLLGGLFFLFRGGGQGGGPMGGGDGPMGMLQSRAKIEVEPETGVTFADVAGCDASKLELEEVVEFLKSPDKFEAVGAQCPRGVILEGPPGTGKTLLARAFVEMFVGVGASRIRSMFGDAKKNAPCIIFIDEIDAIGRQRVSGGGFQGGNDEREQTLNQILTEMDGFSGNSGVIVIAATNRVDILDQALMRPGRFDRNVPVQLADKAGRAEILKVHVRDKPLAPEVDIDTVAGRTIGFSGAQLQNLMNEAAIFAVRRDGDVIEMRDVESALDRLTVGQAKQTGTNNKKRQELVAYHEAGHAIMAAMTPGYDAVAKVTIVPRSNGAGGFTLFTPNEDRAESGMYSFSFLNAQLAVALGGRVAEELAYGQEEVTTGASNDLQQVRDIARRMIAQWGFRATPGSRGENVLRAPVAWEEAEKQMGGPQTASQGAYDKCYATLESNKKLLKAVVDELMDKETIDQSQFMALVAEYGDKEAAVAVAR
ncbi:metalloendopeptidase [Aureococcus anophagefferens]|nr:metalloendopeptidase [Aureococcus anophagefferens]